LGGRIVGLQAWIFEEKHPSLTHDGVAHDGIAGHIVAAGVIGVEAEHGLVKVVDIFGLGVLISLLVLESLLLLVLMLTRSMRNSICDCGSIEGVLTFALACLEEDNALGDTGDG
jgi:hypothetical protein